MAAAPVDELDFLTSATLTRRRDHLHEPDARTAPHRALYFRPNGDADRLLAAASARLEAEPGCVRALLIRASVLVKKGEWKWGARGRTRRIGHRRWLLKQRTLSGRPFKGGGGPAGAGDWRGPPPHPARTCRGAGPAPGARAGLARRAERQYSAEVVAWRAARRWRARTTQHPHPPRAPPPNRRPTSPPPGDHASALADYAAVLELEPDHVDATFGAGASLERLGRVHDAVAAFSAVLATDPRSARALYARGAAHNVLGDFEKANED